MEISSCILSCGSQRLDLGHQTWWPAPLPVEPSHQPAGDFIVKKGRAFLTEEEETMEPVTSTENKLILQDPRRGEALSMSGAKGKRDLNASVSHLSKNPETLGGGSKMGPSGAFLSLPCFIFHINNNTATVGTRVCLVIKACEIELELVWLWRKDQDSR